MTEPARERVVGVIGGSGVYDIQGLEDTRWAAVESPFGAPSDELLFGRLGGTRLVFLPRHGRGHPIPPGEINFRANIDAMKRAGVTDIVSVGAVGSLKEEIVPGHVAIVDQFIDRTKGRPSTFFGDGVVGHVAFGDPISPVLAGVLTRAAREAGATVHEGGTYVCMEGPAFSTRAESNLYRSWGVSVIGMTCVPECKLAREAGLCYGTVAMSTDYDCWHEEEEDVSVEAVIAIVQENADTARDIVFTSVDHVHQYPRSLNML